MKSRSTPQFGFMGQALNQQEAPSEGLVEFFIKETYERRATKNKKEQFTGYVKRAFNEFVEERVSDRLKTALAATSKKRRSRNAPTT